MSVFDRFDGLIVIPQAGFFGGPFLASDLARPEVRFLFSLASGYATIAVVSKASGRAAPGLTGPGHDGEAGQPGGGIGPARPGGVVGVLAAMQCMARLSRGGTNSAPSFGVLTCV